MKEAAIILAEGFEEIEAISVIDILRRAEITVTTLGVNGREISGAHGVKVTADSDIDSYKNIPDAVILPGGLPGAENLKNSKAVNELIKNTHAAGHLVCAICASPALVLTGTGLIDGKQATCYPGFEDQFTDAVQVSESPVVVDGNVITSRGPGTSAQFAFKIVEKLISEDKALALTQGMLYS